MTVVMKLTIMVAVALLVTLALITLEWRTHQLTKGGTTAKGIVALLLVGVLVSLFTVR